MIIKEKFGEIEIIKDENTKEPNTLQYMLRKLQNKNIEIEIEWEDGSYSDNWGVKSFNLPFYHHYTLKISSNEDICIYFYYNGFILFQKAYFIQDIYNLNIYYDEKDFIRPFLCY